MQNSQIHATQPLVSFVIAAYNVPQAWLNACLESILALPLNAEEREVVVVDDGSDTPVAPALQRFVPHVKCIRQANQGLSVARNTGIQQAHGTYIQFVDADDQLLPQPYAQCLQMLKEQRPDMLLFRPTQQLCKGVTPSWHGPVSGAQYMLHHSLQAAAWGYIFKRSILGELKFSPGVQPAEDEEFTPQLLLRAQRLFYTFEAAYWYRINPHSIMHQADKEHVEKRLRDSIQVLLSLQKVAKTLPVEQQSALNRRIAQLTTDFLYNTIRLTRSPQKLQQALTELAINGLYPLPKQRYTLRYCVFRWLIEAAWGRKFLLLALR